MGIGIQVFDNFLPPEEFNPLQSYVMGGNCPWFYNVTKVKTNEPENVRNYQFTHLVYDDYVPHSQLWEGLDPLIRRLHAQSWLRIKCNMTPRTEEPYLYGMHQDIDDFKGITGVFYVNDNNGYTEFDNGIKAESKANRLVLFDSELWHSGVSCTDAKVRCLINLNYLPNPAMNLSEDDMQRIVHTPMMDGAVNAGR